MTRFAPKTSIAKLLVRLGVPADVLTVAGLGFSFYAAARILGDDYFSAGWMLLLSGFLDMLDGAVARESGKSGAFGGILDSSLDRYGDGAVLCALVIHGMQLTQYAFALWAASALVGSFSISYVRARAECETENCRVGFWERGERLVLICLGLFFSNLGAAVCILGVGTHWTVFQRLAFAKIKTAKPSSNEIPFYLRSNPRNSPVYFLKVGILLLLMFFWHPMS